MISHKNFYLAKAYILTLKADFFSNSLKERVKTSVAALFFWSLIFLCFYGINQFLSSLLKMPFTQSTAKEQIGGLIVGSLLMVFILCLVFVLFYKFLQSSKSSQSTLFHEVLEKHQSKKKKI